MYKRQILSTPAPLEGKRAFDDWVVELVGTYTAKELEVKVKEEKGIALD